MAHSIAFSAHAAKEFRKLPQVVRRRLRPHIRALAQNPRPPGVKKLQGEKNTYRIRVGGFRILYEIHDNILRVMVVSVADRKDVY